MTIIQGLAQRILWLFTFLVLKIFSRFRVIGRENIKKVKRPLLVIANHRSFWDPMIIGTLFPLLSNHIPIGFMVADGYYKNYFLRPFFWLTRTSPARKGQGLDISLKAPRRILKAGGVFMIFPIGKRHYVGRPPRPKRGAAALALENPHLTILPVYLKTVSGWKLTEFFFERKKIQAVVGEPFRLIDVTRSRNIDEVAGVLAEEIFKLN